MSILSFIQLSFPVMPTTELFKDFCSISLRAHLSKFLRHFSNVFIIFVEFHISPNLSLLRILASFLPASVYVLHFLSIKLIY